MYNYFTAENVTTQPAQNGKMLSNATVPLTKSDSVSKKNQYLVKRSIPLDSRGTFFSKAYAFLYHAIENTANQSTAKFLYTYALLIKCEVKMAGYWPSSFFRVYVTKQSQYPFILTEQIWSIKVLLNGF